MDVVIAAMLWLLAALVVIALIGASHGWVLLAGVAVMVIGYAVRSKREKRGKK
jgi:membrane-bound ClpP family serine protease